MLIEKDDKAKKYGKPMTKPILVTPNNQNKFEQLVQMGKGCFEARETVERKSYIVFIWYE